MENKNESKKGIIRGISGTLAGILAGVMVGLTPNAQLVSYANQNRVQDENNKGTDTEKKDIERIIDEELGIPNNISKEDRQLLIEKYEKAIYKYMYYQEAKQKLENANTLNLKDEQIEVAAKAYAYLKSEGVKEEQNIGTLVAMFLESGLRPYVTSHDGNFFGALQWSSNQIEKIQEFADRENEENGTDYKYTEIEIQMPYFFEGSNDIFMKDGKSIVESYNEQFFENGAKAAEWLEKEYCRPCNINYIAMRKMASAFEDAFEGKKTTAFKNAFEKSETTTAFENVFLGKKIIRKPEKSKFEEILKEGEDR